MILASAELMVNGTLPAAPIAEKLEAFLSRMKEPKSLICVVSYIRIRSGKLRTVKSNINLVTAHTGAPPMTPIFHTERNRPNTNAHNHSQKGNQTMTQNLFFHTRNHRHCTQDDRLLGNARLSRPAPAQPEAPPPPRSTKTTPVT